VHTIPVHHRCARSASLQRQPASNRSLQLVTPTQALDLAACCAAAPQDGQHPDLRPRRPPCCVAGPGAWRCCSLAAVGRMRAAAPCEARAGVQDGAWRSRGCVCPTLNPLDPKTLPQSQMRVYQLLAPNVGTHTSTQSYRINTAPLGCLIARSTARRMPRTRKPLHAGSWYEDDGEQTCCLHEFEQPGGLINSRSSVEPTQRTVPDDAEKELASQIDGWLDAVAPREGPPVRAIIAP
jgi:hypothetical protein